MPSCVCEGLLPPVRLLREAVVSRLEGVEQEVTRKFCSEAAVAPCSSSPEHQAGASASVFDVTVTLVWALSQAPEALH